MFNADGTKRGSEFQINRPDNQESRSVETLSDGSFVVTWTDANQEVWGQLFNADGTKEGLEFQLDTDSEVSEEDYIAPDPSTVEESAEQEEKPEL